MTSEVTRRRAVSPAETYLASLAPGSVPSVRGSLTRLARLLGYQDDPRAVPWHELRYEYTAALRAALARDYEPATANAYLSRLKGVLRECWRLGLMTRDQYERAVDIRTVRGSREPAGRYLTPDELAAMFRACQEDETAAADRDPALLAVLLGCGLRRAEVVALDLSDYDRPTTRRHAALHVRHGKGNKERTVFLPSGAVPHLERWISRRGRGEGALFFPLTEHGGMTSGRRLSASALYRMVKRRMEQAGLEPLSPHDFRRTFITDLLAAGVDVAVAGKLAGHASPATTVRYDRRPDEVRAEAVEVIQVPE